MQSCQKIELPALRTLRNLFLSVLQFDSHRRNSIVRVTAILLVAFFGSGSVVPTSVLHAQQVTAIDREYAIKAAFLYHFLTYIDWPEGTFEDSKQPFVIGVFGTDPFGAVLDKIAATKKVGSRPIEIRRLTSTDKLLECQIVFLAESVNAETQKKVLALLADSHVLCVGETDDFVEFGGAAQFFVEGNKVRFAFNTDVVDRNNLKVSSKLLSLAKIVTTR